jgi:hypothetical protein
MPVKLAAVTMVYNEPDYMDLWCRHYARQVGAEGASRIRNAKTDNRPSWVVSVGADCVAVRLPQPSPCSRCRSA